MTVRKRIQRQHKLSQRIAELDDEWSELCSQRLFEEAMQVAQRIQELKTHLNNLRTESWEGPK